MRFAMHRAAKGKKAYRKNIVLNKSAFLPQFFDYRYVVQNFMKN